MFITLAFLVYKEQTFYEKNNFTSISPELVRTKNEMISSTKNEYARRMRTIITVLLYIILLNARTLTVAASIRDPISDNAGIKMKTTNAWKDDFDDIGAFEGPRKKSISRAMYGQRRQIMNDKIKERKRMNDDDDDTILIFQRDLVRVNEVKALVDEERNDLFAFFPPADDDDDDEVGQRNDIVLEKKSMSRRRRKLTHAIGDYDDNDVENVARRRLMRSFREKEQRAQINTSNIKKKKKKGKEVEWNQEAFKREPREYEADISLKRKGKARSMRYYFDALNDDPTAPQQFYVIPERRGEDDEVEIGRIEEILKENDGGFVKDGNGFPVIVGGKYGGYLAVLS